MEIEPTPPGSNGNRTHAARIEWKSNPCRPGQRRPLVCPRAHCRRWNLIPATWPHNTRHGIDIQGRSESPSHVTRSESPDLQENPCSSSQRLPQRKFTRRTSALQIQTKIKMIAIKIVLNWSFTCADQSFQLSVDCLWSIAAVRRRPIQSGWGWMPPFKIFER